MANIFAGTRFDGMSFEEAYQEWLRVGHTIQDRDERRKWKIIFFTRSYGIGPDKLKKIFSRRAY